MTPWPGGGAALSLALLIATSPMNAQEPGRAPDGSIDNLRHPPGTETVELGTLGTVVRRGSGPLDMLLIPGSAFGAEVWASFMERNADRYTMWAVSLPGYGRTDPPPMPSWADLPATPWLDGAQAALRRLISEEMDRPVVVGHHLEGDYHALRLALEYSEEISGVVVMAGNPGRSLAFVDSTGTRRAARPEERVAALEEQWIPFWRSVAPETWSQNTFQAAMLSTDPALGETLVEVQRTTSIPTTVRYFVEYLTTNLPPRLPELPVPLLVVAARAVDSLGEHFDRGAARIMALPEFQGMDAREARAAYIASRLERFGTESAALRAIYGARWLEMATPPPDMEVETVGPSGIFVFDDRPADVDRILTSWIARHQIASTDLEDLGVDVELTFVFDTDPGVVPDDVGVTIDGESVGTVDGSGVIAVSLEPGEHEVIGISASGAAVRQTIVVPDDGRLAETLVLRSESLGQVRDYTLVTNGALEDGTLPVPGELAFSFVDPSGAALELTDLNMVRVARIETSSFSPAGGIAVSSSLFLTDQFSIVDNAIVADTPAATISEIISSLGVGEYEVEIAAGDDGLGLPYDGFALLRFGGFRK